MKKLLVIRADSTTKMGIGHVMRCIALGQTWQDSGGKVVFISHCESNALRERIIDEGFYLVSIQHPHPHPDDLSQTLEYLKYHSPFTIHHSPTWLVVDGYHFDSAYQKAIKEADHRLLWIDDYGHAEHYCADIVLNQNILVDPSVYVRRESFTRLLLGTRYVLLSREFRRRKGGEREIPAIARKVLVTMGGGDPDNVTLKVVRALKQVPIARLEATIIIGPANPHLQTVEEEIDDHPNFRIVTNATHMPELLAWADVAVSAGGSTCWEMAFMGLPNLLIILADNQAEVAARLHDQGLSVNMGWHKNVCATDIATVISNLMKSTADRCKMIIAGQRFVDGKGNDRIIKALSCEDLLLRKASSEDGELLWKWVNESDARRSAFNSEFIPFNEHERWFRNKLNDDSCVQLIAFTHGNNAVGQVRFDLKNDDAEVDVSVAKNYRRLGWGALLIVKGISEIIRTFKIRKFHAHVKPSNNASLVIFQEAGFVHKADAFINGHPSHHMVLEIE